MVEEEAGEDWPSGDQCSRDFNALARGREWMTGMVDCSLGGDSYISQLHVIPSALDGQRVSRHDAVPKLLNIQIGLSDVFIMQNGLSKFFIMQNATPETFSRTRDLFDGHKSLQMRAVEQDASVHQNT